MAKTLLFLTIILLSSSLIYSQNFLGTDVLKCNSDIIEINTKFQSFLTQGITLDALIAQFNTAGPLINQALSDCAYEIVSSKCLSDLNGLAQVITIGTADMASNNILKFTQDLNQAKVYVSAIISDCSAKLHLKQSQVLSETAETEPIIVNGILECYSDIKNLIPELLKFIAIAKTGVISDIIAEVNVLVTDLKTVVADCQLESFSEFKDLVSYLNTLSPIDCLTDVSELVKLAESIVSNFNNSQYEQLMQNLVQFVNTIKQTTSDCSVQASSPQRNEIVI